MMDIGREYEKSARDNHIIDLFRRKHKVGVTLIRHMKIVDYGLGLTGVSDYVVVHKDRYYPMEIKYSENPFIYVGQLTAYAVLLERKFGHQIRRGYFYHGYDLKEELSMITIPAVEKLKVIDKIDIIRKNLLSAQRPKPTLNTNKCYHCEYRNFCNDIL